MNKFLKDWWTVLVPLALLIFALYFKFDPIGDYTRSHFGPGAEGFANAVVIAVVAIVYAIITTRRRRRAE